MFLKEVLREIRLTLIQVSAYRFWGLWVLAIVVTLVLGFVKVIELLSKANLLK